jgi:leucyl-tRNA synthetase
MAGGGSVNDLLPINPPATPTWPSTATPSTTGCRSTSTSVGWSTLSFTSCTPASSPRCACDLGLVGFEEPFKNLFTQGMIYYKGGGSSPACAKMSKSKGNVVSPDEMVAKYGADSVRSYVLFMGPAESDAEWNDQGVEGVYRFLGRVWRTVTDSLADGSLSDVGGVAGGGANPGVAQLNGSEAAARFDETALTAAERTLLVKTNQVVQKATIDLGQRFRFNTALAALMELSNDIGAARASGLAATPSNSPCR